MSQTLLEQGNWWHLLQQANHIVRIREEATPKPPPPAATPAQSLVDPQVLKVIQEVIDEIFQNIDKCPENVDPITFLHKLLVVDCGGQPQFHEVLLIFLRKMSMIVFVIKLSEELSSHPMIEYFENGKRVGTPYRSDHTTEQLIQRGLQSLHSHRSSKDKGAGSDTSKIIVIGTHKDEEHKCKESWDAKNARLSELLLPTFKKEIIYFHVGTKKVLFLMNAKHPGQEEEDMAKTIRCAVTIKSSGCSNKAAPAVVGFGNCFGEGYIDSQARGAQQEWTSRNC